MSLNSQYSSYISIPDGFIVFISGVPGVGKTTIAYELLKSYTDFRIIEETDLIREILRGYNEYIKTELGTAAQAIFENIQIYDHMKFLTFYDAKQQCNFMKKSFENIVLRQQRKGIPSILNGVHIVPEALNGLIENRNIIYINLFINNEEGIINRLKSRDPMKYDKRFMSLIYKTNMDLYKSTSRLSDKTNYIFNNIDVTDATVPETLSEVIDCITERIKSTS